jgi:outer membrane protein W
MRNFSACVGIALLALVNATALAEDSEGSIKIRPQAGIGSLDGDKSYHAGLRLLFKASDDKKYGMELSRIFTDKVEYIVAGVILERKNFGWLNLSIGSVGYFGQSSGTHNLPGMLFNFGWEPETTSAIKPFVTIRYDNIFADKLIAGTAISAGLSAIF